MKLDPPPNSKDSYSDVDPASIPNGGKHFSMISDLSNPCKKTEALLCVFVMLCINLNAIKDWSFWQVWFPECIQLGILLQQSRLLPFPTSSSNSPSMSGIHPKVESILHGKPMMDLLTPPEESFIHFVTFMDLIHFTQLPCCLV